MTVTEEQLTEIIDYLQGTCKSLEEGISAILDIECENADEYLTLEQFYYIDEHIFLCDTCGWWCEVGDFSANDEDYMVCSECGDYMD